MSAIGTGKMSETQRFNFYFLIHFYLISVKHPVKSRLPVVFDFDLYNLFLIYIFINSKR